MVKTASPTGTAYVQLSTEMRSKMAHLLATSIIISRKKKDVIKNGIDWAEDFL